MAKDFDPSDKSVDEVKAHLEKADSDERQRVLDAELGGRKRKTILDAYGVNPNERADAARANNEALDKAMAESRAQRQSEIDAAEEEAGAGSPQGGVTPAGSGSAADGVAGTGAGATAPGASGATAAGAPTATPGGGRSA